MRLKTISLSMVLMFLSLFGLGSHVFAAVDCSADNLSTQQAVQCGVNGGSNGSNPDEATSNLNTTIKKGLNILTAIVGVAAVAMIIFGGFRYITSAGKQESVASAKNTLLYAIVGLIIVALAQIIVHFVITSVNPQCIDHQWDSGPKAGQSC